MNDEVVWTIELEEASVTGESGAPRLSASIEKSLSTGFSLLLDEEMLISMGDMPSNSRISVSETGPSGTCAMIEVDTCTFYFDAISNQIGGKVSQELFDSLMAASVG